LKIKDKKMEVSTKCASCGMQSAAECGSFCGFGRPLALSQRLTVFSIVVTLVSEWAQGKMSSKEQE
jgi:hypothetical protein